MPSKLIYLLLFLLLLLVLIGLTEIVHRLFKVSSEKSRKFLHVTAGIICLPLPFFFNSHWWVLPLALISFLLLLVTYKKKLLPSIHNTKRFSVGSVLFPLPVYGCFLVAEIVHDNLFFYLPVSLLAIADTAAEAGGNKWGRKSKQFFEGQKTLAGSLCFLVTALVVTFAWLYIIYPWPLIEVLIAVFVISVTATIAELVTLHGWDNLSIPAIVALVLLAI